MGTPSPLIQKRLHSFRKIMPCCGALGLSLWDAYKPELSFARLIHAPEGVDITKPPT